MDGEKLRILHVSYGGLNHGGVCSVILSIVETLYDRFDFGCVVFRTIGDNESDFLKYGQLHRLPCYLKDGKGSFIEKITRPFRLFFGILHICKKYKYDVIHVHNGDDEGICLLAARCAGVKCRIAHSHNSPSPKKMPFSKKVVGKLNRLLIKKNATKKIGCSSLACSTFFKSDDYAVFYNTVNLVDFDIKKRKKHDGINFIHVGRYCYQKNQSFVIKVFNEIHKQVKSSKLMLVGFGEDEQMLKDDIIGFELNDVVEMIPGDKVSISECFALADYMIFPSVYEGFGIVLIEAQAMGCYCFASNAIQKEADAGYMTVIGLEKNEKQWAEEILRKISDKKEINMIELHERMRKYESQEVAKQYERLYFGETKA